MSRRERNPAGLEEMRVEIERIDREIVELVAARVAIARRAGDAKRAAGLPTLDTAREAAVVRRAVGHARAAGLEEEDLRALFWSVVALSRRAQTEER
jgi:chorismate mutase